MTPILGLLIVVRIEVDIVNDACVGGRQVDAHATGFGGEQKHENAVVVIEVGDQVLADIYGCRSVQAAETELSYPQILLHNVQHHSELAEEQHTVPLLLQLRQQRVQVPEFPGIADQLIGYFDVVKFLMKHTF